MPRSSPKIRTARNRTWFMVGSFLACGLSSPPELRADGYSRRKSCSCLGDVSCSDVDGYPHRIYTRPILPLLWKLTMEAKLFGVPLVLWGGICLILAVL